MDIPSLYNLYLKHSNVCTDSRKVEPGVLFFALRGERFDGNKYALQAIEQGAAYAVVDDPEETHEKWSHGADALETLQALARHHRQELNVPVLAITGSNGKTTTKELCLAVFQQKYKVWATPGNFNNHIGLPLTLLQAKPDTELLILEMGDNKPGDIAELCAIAEPNYGYITNVGKDHLEGYGSQEKNVATKGELFRYLEEHGGTAFVHQSDPEVSELAQGIEHLHFFGAPDTFAYLTLLDTAPALSYRDESGETVRTHLVGTYNFANIQAADCLGKYFEVPASDRNAAIAGYIPANNRSQWVETDTNTILLDAYNANPSSVEQALLSFEAMHHDKPKGVVLGDMLELGSFAADEHQAVVDHLQRMELNRVVLVGKHYGETNMPNSFLHFKETGDAQAHLAFRPVRGEFLLLKGSRSLKLETLLDLL